MTALPISVLSFCDQSGPDIILCERGLSGFGEFDSKDQKWFLQKNVPRMQFPTQIDRRMITLGLRVEDVDERFVKGTGAGGQKINKTSSTVWLRHRPSGVEVRCQAGRSQAANREQAWGELCDKLEAIRRDAKLAVKQEKETERRRTRQKSPRQKARMVDAKKHRSRHKAHRGRVRDHD